MRGHGDSPLVARNDWGVLTPPPLGDWEPRQPVSVVVPARDCPATLAATLAALSRQTYPPSLLEVVVVDDGSEPKLELPEVVPAHTRLVRVADHATGWGRAQALAVGARVSDGEILHWLDADLIPFPEHVEAQARWHHLADDVVTLGYKRFVERMPSLAEVVRRATDGTLVDLYEADEGIGHDYVEQLIDDSDQLRAADHLAFRAHVGATAALRRGLYTAAGGLDTGLRLGEDTEFGYRLAQAGAVFVPEPRARSWHLGLSQVMRDGARVRRHNRPYLAARMPHPRWLRGHGHRHWDLPLVTAVVPVGEAPFEQVRSCVDRLLGGTEPDLRVQLMGAWSTLSEQRRAPLDDPWLDQRLLAEAYRTEPRVDVVHEEPATAFPSPYLLRVPPTLGVGPETVERLVRAADEQRVGLVRSAPATDADTDAGTGEDLGDGGGATGPVVELWRTAAVSRARRRLPASPLAEAVAAVWGERWLEADDADVVDLTAPPVPPEASPTATAAAPAAVDVAVGPAARDPVRPVPVAGIRSWLRATGYVARLALRRLRRR